MELYERAHGAYGILKMVYTPRYLALNALLGAVYYALFLYLASIQGGGSIMLTTNPLLVAGLIATSSIVLTMSVYLIRNRRRSYAQAEGTATSLGSVVIGTGLCGCTTTFPAVIAAGIGISSTGVYALTGFLKTNGPYIFMALIAANVIVMAYYFSGLFRPVWKK